VLGSAGDAAVEVRTAGAWRHIGRLGDGYADLPAGGPPVDAIRLTWDSGSPAPVIAEVVPIPAE
jgi:hyaluronoglucosaminidase